jgi:hypothetical protein
LYVRKLRKNERAHVREICECDQHAGLQRASLIGKNDVVIDGGSRLEAAKLLGMSSVPCIRVDHLDETEQRLLRLAVNRLGEKGFLGSWRTASGSSPMHRSKFQGLMLTRLGNISTLMGSFCKF